MVSVVAQNHHFVYFESQNNKPFIIKHENKIYSSAQKNYINLSKLNNTNFQIKLDIENEKYLSFTINLNDNDGGFIVKQNANKDWVLFDILNFTTLLQDKFIQQQIVETKSALITEPSINIDTTKTIVPFIESVDSSKTNITLPSAFIPNSALIDTTITATVSTPIKSETESNDSLKLKKENIDLQLSKKIIDKIFSIEKIHHAEILTGIEQTYIEKNGILIDTITIFIPFKKTINNDTIKEIVQPKVEDIKMVSTNIDAIGLKENDCLRIATELEFTNFIKELQKTAIIKNKLNLAAAILGSKCFTASQIQRLSVMFMYDKAKLDFFKLAIKSVADIKNFHFLENEIKDVSIKQEFLDLLKP